VGELFEKTVGSNSSQYSKISLVLFYLTFVVTVTAWTAFVEDYIVFSYWPQKFHANNFDT
jgi:hypothetical protein